MPPDPRAYLWDAHRAAALVASFVDGRSWEEYEGDPMLRSAIERQFIIVGEALNAFRRVEVVLAERVPELPRIVAFRNLLVHSYVSVDDRLVWEVAIDRTPELVTVLLELLGELGEP